MLLQSAAQSKAILGLLPILGVLFLPQCLIFEAIETASSVLAPCFSNLSRSCFLSGKYLCTFCTHSSIKDLFPAVDRKHPQTGNDLLQAFFGLHYHSLITFFCTICIMKASTVLSLALLGFATASPVPQDIDFDSYEDIPVLPDLAAPIGAPTTTVVVSTYNPTVAASEAVAAATETSDPDLTRRHVIKRGSCLAQPAGNGPAVTPDTDSAFLANPAFATAANSAVAPPGYFLAVGYKNLQASASAPSYQTYISSSLTKYDPAVCAAKCNSISGCVSFNICRSFPSSSAVTFTDCYRL